MKSCLGRVVLGLVGVVLIGCGGGDGDKSSGDDVVADGLGEVATVDVQEPEEIAPQCPSSSWVMEFFGINDGMTIETGETMLLQARIFDSVLGETVEGAEVSFTLSGDGNAELLETTALTSELGVAAVSFSTGSDLGVVYTVEASSPCTDDQSVTLSTVAPEQGSFMITYSLSTELTETWEQLTVVAYADNTVPLCGAVDYTKPGSQGVELPAGESTIEFTQIQANAAYVVFGVAYNPEGVPVGGGCTEGVSVLPDMTTDTDVAIESLAMNPAGGYDLTVQVAAKELMAMQWLDAGAVIEQLIDESGQTIGKKVIDDILIFFPDGPPDCGEFDALADIQASIDAGLENLDSANIDWLAANADQWLATLTANVIFKGKLNGHRPRNRLVFQDHGLFPWMTVLDNVAFDLEIQGVGRAERRTRARAFVEQFGLGGFAECYPEALSVGMRQRVGIARAFLADPHMLLMDEPLGSVDAQTKRVLQEELLTIWERHQKLVVYVTHDVEEAVQLADRVLVMTGRPGRILEEIRIPLGRPRHVSKDRPEVTEIKWHIWQMLEDEARKSLSATA